MKLPIKSFACWQEEYEDDLWEAWTEYCLEGDTLSYQEFVRNAYEKYKASFVEWLV